jgi:hypothetical protein
MSKIESISPEQSACIPEWVDKWTRIGLSTEPTDFDKAERAVRATYALIGLEPPKIVLCVASPKAAIVTVLAILLKQFEDSPGLELDTFQRALQGDVASRIASLQDGALSTTISLAIGAMVTLAALNQIHYLVHSDVSFNQLNEITGSAYSGIIESLRPQLNEITGSAYSGIIESLRPQSNEICNCSYGGQFYAEFGAGISFIRDVLGWDDPVLENFKINEDLITSCGWVLWTNDVVAISDRPQEILRDEQGHLHAEGKQAISYRDGWGVYAYHGVIIPEAWGKIKPSQWDSKWILTEKNAERRRVLIQAIGYARLVQELNATKLDSWREYELFKVQDETLDIEPIVMVKMTCPSTGLIHAHRVPPAMQSAREAITWVNRGIDPEHFVTEN